MKKFYNKHKITHIIEQKLYDPEILVGCRFWHKRVSGIITKFNGRLWDVNFDSDFIDSRGLPIRQGSIDWPDMIELSDSQFVELENSPGVYQPSSKDYAEMARNEAIYESYLWNKNESVSQTYHECDCDDDSEIIIVEATDYNDSASRGHEEGWFYADED